MSRNQKRFVQVLVIILCFAVGFTFFSDVSRAQDDTKETLRIGVFREIESLNPLIAYSAPAYEVLQLNYNLLVTWDQDLQPVPNLAKDWSSNEDGTQWTLYLEEGVSWHDGEPFTSEDVKFTFEYLRDNGLSYFYEYVAPVIDIETPDENTIVLKFEEASAWMPQLWVPILPKHIWEGIDPEEAETTYENSNPIGTGPFQVVEHKKGQFTRMAANKDYFKGAPEIDEVVITVYGNASTAAEALKLGEVDVLTEIPAAQFRSLEGEPDIVTLDSKSPSFVELAINSWTDSESKGNPLLADKNIRVAMDYAVDREHLIDAVLFGYGEVGSTLVPPMYEYWHYSLDPQEKREFNLDKAREVLEEAGYTDVDGDGIRQSTAGELLDFDLLLRSESPEEVRMGRIIAEWFNDIGINVNIEVVDSGVLTDRIYDNGDYDMFIWGYYMDVDPTSILRIMTTDQILSWNDSFFSNSEYDRLFALQEKQIDWEERQQTVYEMQRIVYEEAPYIIIAYGPELQAYRTDRFEGWVRTPTEGSIVFTHSMKTYENLTPIAQEPVVEADVAGSDDSSSGGSPALWLIGIVVIGAVVFSLRKGKKS
ncbi:MAG: hypothetical protein APF76_16395 [Desulfitibacter sp. BRH_c19]|nr:MAG: hypothetical protein APF76_16395 [Desulfitibacter sp. BRH_c19]